MACDCTEGCSYSKFKNISELLLNRGSRMRELKHSDLDLLCLHNHYLISFQMQQPDLQLNIWLSANIPIQLVWFQNGACSWNVYRQFLKIPSKELSSSWSALFLPVWSQKFVEMRLENVTDHNMYKFTCFYLTDAFYMKSKLSPPIAGALPVVWTREGLAPAPHKWHPALLLPPHVLTALTHRWANTCVQGPLAVDLKSEQYSFAVRGCHD